ncbi:hypothetical protein MRB53_042357 [Persea americana]|nr:hypothetical protein MRB53_042357 [Persea americana]
MVIGRRERRARRIEVRASDSMLLRTESKRRSQGYLQLQMDNPACHHNRVFVCFCLSNEGLCKQDCLSCHDKSGCESVSSSLQRQHCLSASV